MDAVIEEKIIQNAMALFWQRGAEVAPYNEIVTATGVSRKALYLRWPDKTALVHDTLKHYREMLLAMISDTLDGGDINGLREFLRILREVSRENEWKGCYLFRTAAGPLRDDPVIQQITTDYVKFLAKSIQSCIENAQSKQQLPEEFNAEFAGLQAAALLALVSTVGGQHGGGEMVEKLFDAAEAATGLVQQDK